MVLHRIDDAARALSTEPHRGFLLKALRYAPEGETLATTAARVLHRELLPFTVARDVADPEGLLLVELDPQGVSVNLAMLTLRPGSTLFPELLRELLAWARGLGFHRLEAASRRPGMRRFLRRHGWHLLGPNLDTPTEFGHYGFIGKACRRSGWSIGGSSKEDYKLPGFCAACGEAVMLIRLPNGNLAMPWHLDGGRPIHSRPPLLPAYDRPTLADLPEGFPFFRGDE